jgi:hypothetical protein
MELKVPIGTMVKDINGRVLHIFSRDGESWKVVKGGE